MKVQLILPGRAHVSKIIPQRIPLFLFQLTLLLLICFLFSRSAISYSLGKRVLYWYVLIPHTTTSGPITGVLNSC